MLVHIASHLPAAISSGVNVNRIETQIGGIEYLSTRDGYDRWATIYDTEQNPLVALEEPHVDGLLGDVRGLSVLDLGCGTGRHTLRLASRGADVTAVDFSEGMLALAREKTREFTVRFIAHDLAAPLPLPDRSFDRVLCGLVLDHIADLPLIFSEMRRVCRPSPGGLIVVSIMHPAMMLRGVQARFTDPLTGRETRPASQPHQMSDYVMAALGAGLTIDHFSEHLADADLAQRCPRAQKHLGWPLLMMMRLLGSCESQYAQERV
jgi:malonyl-CoA O-methyltransferase